jgi:prepilin peptidase CpaA
VVPTLPLPIAVVLAAVVVAAVTDVWKFKVHNLLTLPLLLAGLVYHGIVGGGEGLGNSLLGLVFGFGSLFAFYVMGGMGGGDVKLMAAVGAWLGMPLTLYVFAASALAAGAYALLLVLMSGRVRETWVNLKIIWYRVAAVGRHLAAEDHVEAEVKREDRRRRVIPFAAMMALGTFALLLWAWSEGAL